MVTQVIDQVPRVQFIATSGQTIFAYNFQIFLKTDITVEQNGTPLTVDVDFTVSGVGTTTGGNVTLTVGATVNDIITIFRSQNFDRETDYQESGDFLSETVNDDFNRSILMLQQNREELSRTLQYSIDDIVGLNALPLSALRPNTFFTWDSSGNPGVASSLSITTGSAETVSSIALLKLLAPADGDSVFVTGYNVDSDGGGGHYQFDAASVVADNGGTVIIPTAGGAGRWILSVVGEISVNQFGAVVGGVIDASTAFINATNVVEVDGGKLTANPGTYLLSTQWELIAPGSDGRILIDFYGVEIITTGAISGVRVGNLSGVVNGGVSIKGLKVNHRANSDATLGFDIEAAWNTVIDDCTVEAHGVNASYKGLRLGNSDATDSSTGSFWTKINNFRCRKRTGSDVGDMPIGILLEGNANATGITGGALLNCIRGVKIGSQDSEDPVPNGITLFDIDFEGNEICVDHVGTAASTIVGPRILSCRAESPRVKETISAITQANPAVVTSTAVHGLATGDVVGLDAIVGMTELNDRDFTVTVLTTTTFELDGEDSTGHTAYVSDGNIRLGIFYNTSGLTGTPAVPTYLSANFLSSAMTMYIKNPNSLFITSLDLSLVPDFFATGMMSWVGATTIGAEDGSAFPLTLNRLGGSRGLRLQNAAGVSVAQLLFTGTDNQSELRAVAARDLTIRTVRAISQTTTRAENLRGDVTFSTSGTATVTFATAEADATYFITIAGDIGESFFVTSKTTAGFTMNSSNASSTATVDWILIR